MSSEEAQRVQKILSQAAIASRRKAEEMIIEGQITINGKIAKLGDKAIFGKDSIKVNGKLLCKVESAPVYLAFYKPRGVLSTLLDPEKRPVLTDYIKKINTRVFPVGRLDFNCEGILLLTNDGQWSNAVQKKSDIPKVYEVKIKGHPSLEVLSGVFKRHKIQSIQKLKSKTKVEIALLGTGSNDLKALFERKGFWVERMLLRSVGNVSLKNLRPGELRFLKQGEAQGLLLTSTRPRP